MPSDTQVEKLIENSERFAATVAQLPVQFENVNGRFERVEKATELLIVEVREITLTTTRTEVEIKAQDKKIEKVCKLVEGLNGEIEDMEKALDRFKIRMLLWVVGICGSVIGSIVILAATGVMKFG